MHSLLRKTIFALGTLHSSECRPVVAWSRVGEVLSRAIGSENNVGSFLGSSKFRAACRQHSEIGRFDMKDTARSHMYNFVLSR